VESRRRFLSRVLAAGAVAVGAPASVWACGRRCNHFRRAVSLPPAYPPCGSVPPAEPAYGPEFGPGREEWEVISPLSINGNTISLNAWLNFPWTPVFDPKDGNFNVTVHRANGEQINQSQGLTVNKPSYYQPIVKLEGSAPYPIYKIHAILYYKLQFIPLRLVYAEGDPRRRRKLYFGKNDSTPQTSWVIAEWNKV
jgi:hypothetical protein